ncbi:MAG: metalloenzyme [Ignavibacteriae bacterium]|nr:metalloenzyme [Ignavibacteriota bacterium]NOG99152.1 metalloenzyme [Ignavibacteriota bacterium]
MHSTLMIFIDGVGIGENDPKKNPFFNGRLNFAKIIFGASPHLGDQHLQSDNKYLFPVDACMGVKGLPQSGTGQTSIFCGVNAPKINKGHFGPYPPAALKQTLKEKNIFREFLNRNLNVEFVNAYPKIFFDYINSGRKRLSATSLSCLLSGVKLKNSTDLRRGQALSAEIDNSRWVNKLNYTHKIIKPETAANRLFKIAQRNHFTLFEYFLTDHIGHGRIKDEADATLKVLDKFLIHVLRNIPKNISLIICSDHGNIEDMSVKMHTRNPALGITAGLHAEELSQKINSLYDIKNSILGYYS